jgi:hypothetical protein
MHEPDIKIYWFFYLFYNASVDVYIYNSSVRPTIKLTEPLHPLEPMKTKILKKIKSEGLHFHFVDKIGISVFLAYMHWSAQIGEVHQFDDKFNFLNI